MKKALLMTGALLALTCGLAMAGPGGLSLAWLDCDGGGAGGAHNRNFACNTNRGDSHPLVGSFLAPSFANAVTGFAAVLDVQAASITNYPDWWNIRFEGGCRPTSSVSSFDFTTVPASPCYDYWQAGAAGGHSMDAPIGNRARIKVTAALPAGDSRITSIPEGLEVNCFRLTLLNSRTAGLGACSGCLTGVCIVLNSILITNAPGNPAGNKFISFPVHNTATWQGGISPAVDCLNATPAKTSTWGQVKSLYR